MCTIILTFQSLLWKLVLSVDSSVFALEMMDGNVKRRTPDTEVTPCTFCPLQTEMNPLYVQPQDQVKPLRLDDVVFRQDYGDGVCMAKAASRNSNL